MTIISGINQVPTVGSAIELSVYAFSGTGGFDMEAGFATVTRLDQASNIVTYEVTNALQIELPALFFNSRLGTYDPLTQAFGIGSDPIVPNDSITILASDFKTALASKTQIVHVGAYSGMYTKFQTYVTTYFGLPNGFASLFAKSSATLFLSGADDQENLFNLFTIPSDPSVGMISEENDDISGNYIKDLSGSIVISNIVQALRFAVDFNAFGNRTPVLEGEANGAANFGVNDGFLPGDLFYIPTGTKITLDLDISPELQQVPLNNPNSSTSSAFGISGVSITGLTTTETDAAALFNTTSSSGDYSIASTVTRTNIHRILKVPLLLRVVA